jgi:hypothetical protein
MKATIKKKKKVNHVLIGFDAIQTMRAIRDKISIEIMDMNYEEELTYLNSHNTKK